MKWQNVKFIGGVQRTDYKVSVELWFVETETSPVGEV